MKNKEKYFDELIECITKGSYYTVCSGFIKPKVLCAENCYGIACEECKQKLKKWLEQEYVEPPKTVWDLKENDEYYSLNENGVTFKDSWVNHPIDLNRRARGNSFLTEEEAEYEKRRREVYAIVKKHAYEFSREEWANASINKYHPYYNFNIKKC